MKDFFKSTKTYIWGAAILLIVAAAVLIAAFSSNETVAEVDGNKISKDELYDALVSQYGATVLDTMITNKLVDLEADKEKVKITDKEIQTELDTMMESYGGKDTFEAQLASSGLKTADIEEDIRSYLKTVKLLEPRIKITDDEMKEYFEANKDQYAQAEQVEASHILVKDEATAKEVATKLADGGDFTKLAKEYSTDAANASNGGKLGYFGKDEMAPEFEKAAFSMKINEISDPVKTEFGYHIIQVTGKKEAKAASFEDSKKDIKEALKTQKLSSEFPTWLTETKKDHKISNTLVPEK
ncbi:peptidylprolyl isomerase [Peribacillus sp. JNUCC 23]|uniref:peptidylprolyl isomerase n=1 Tax=Peribacillus sp. NPDC096379 TaxID=3364393 RepID=UPI00382B139A